MADEAARHQRSAAAAAAEQRMKKEAMRGKGHRQKGPSDEESEPVILTEEDRQRAELKSVVLAVAREVWDGETSTDAGLVAKQCIATIKQLTDNVLKEPAERKYRRIKCDNAAIRRKILQVPGGTDLLLAGGWELVDGEKEWSCEKASVSLLLATTEALNECLFKASIRSAQ
eukprot:TRINITY_DN6796_c0_g1_i4.p1 TRINITY_DN6796_c0_g1~~TRINITY_DN6796_c0_g1_i4.p1  ORF type:complete len:172 (+),score=36.73 TRINITY_DN6796_c0_g1_i4:127-642(+)